MVELKTIESLKDFIDCAKRSTNEYIYVLFENHTTEDIRTEIYAHADKDSTEPFRSAMHNLGFTTY